MSKGFLLFLLAAFVLAGAPSVAEDLSATALPLFLTSTPAASCAAPMTSAAAPTLPDLTPKPESRVLLCGECSDFACAGKRAYHGCSIAGELSYCRPDLACENETTVQCYCEPL